MNFRARFFSLWLALLWCSLAAAASAVPLEASVDRSIVTQGDSLVLTIRQRGSSSGDRPDYRVLEPDFHVFGNSESSRHVISNGRAESWTEWQTTLIPKRSGALVIPSILVAGARTEPIRIQVEPIGAAGSRQHSQETVFVEAELDRDNVYVQQQLLLKVRIFSAVPLDDMSITEPEFDTAEVRKVAQDRFRREIDGVTYQVNELAYVIFPREPGELTIPELVFSARQPVRSRSFFDFPGQGRGLRKMTPQLNVRVKPIPANFTGPVWLPARNLTLVESWGGNPRELAVGESITRSVTVQADGLSAAQLPAAVLPQSAGARLYGDQPVLDDQDDAAGAHGKRVDSAALIPAQAGPLTLPETRVVWWDVESDSPQVATLPATTLSIRPGAANAGAAPVVAEPEPALAPAAAPAAGPAPIPLWWPAIAAALAAAWLLTLALYWRLRRQLQNKTPQPAAAVDQPEAKTLLRAALKACVADDAAAARTALLSWARAFYRDPTLNGLDQLARRQHDAALRAELQRLDSHLFGTETTPWRGEQLAALLRQLPAQPADDDVRTALPALNPG